MEDFRNFTVSGLVLTTPAIQYSYYTQKKDVVVTLQCAHCRYSKKDPTKLLTPKFTTIDVVFMDELANKILREVKPQDHIFIKGKITSSREAEGYLSHKTIRLCANSFKKIKKQEFQEKLNLNNQ